MTPSAYSQPNCRKSAERKFSNTEITYRLHVKHLSRSEVWLSMQISILLTKIDYKETVQQIQTIEIDIHL
jgi:hypothetical protein